jgi:hypothetical protein
MNIFVKRVLLKLLQVRSILFSLAPRRVKLKKRIGKHISYSQACQDLFVIEMLKGKRQGLYLEIGAYDEIDQSNTYLLEAKYNWTGVSIELDKEAVDDFNKVRKNKCICADATKIDYLELLQNSFVTTQIDYLSLDIEPAQQTLEVLKKLPLNEYRFSVVTYEHDRYTSGDACMIESRKILESHGYVRVVSNVMVKGQDFEDWWVDPGIVSDSLIAKYESSNSESREIFNKS